MNANRQSAIFHRSNMSPPLRDGTRSHWVWMGIMALMCLLAAGCQTLTAPCPCGASAPLDVITQPTRNEMS